MTPSPSHNPDNGQWVNGHTPWNTGTSQGGRRHTAQKGRCGFQPRPVLLLLPDGTIGARFASVSAAARHLQRNVSSIADSCMHGSLCCNRRLIYEEDYVKWADYSYHPHPNRDARGHFFKGCPNLYRLSPEALARKKAKAAKRSAARAKDPNDPWGKGGPLKPILCVTTGQTFPSIESAARAFNIPAYYISQAISRRGSTRHLTFRRITPSLPE